ncbi:hypothetical protein OAL67_01410 [bacterium]|nr:hypothetical protein [bacterium]
MKFSNKKFIVPIYIIFLLLVFFYVKSVLNQEEIDIGQKEEDHSEVQEVKPVVVYLEIGDPAIRTYRSRLKNVNSVLDFFEYLRENEGFSYEITAHRTNIIIDHVNYIRPMTEYHRWAIFDASKPFEITNVFENTALEDGKTYVLKQITRTSMPQ